MLARLLGFPAVKVERGLMLFLAVLVEIGAALGLYFATGHMRPGSAANRGRGVTIIDAEILADLPPLKRKGAPLKQIAGPAPRRVPKMKQRGVQA